MARELRGAMAALFTCSDPEVLVEGRAGTSKTTGILTKIIHRAERYPGSRHLIVRATRTSLSDSVMVTFDKLVLPGHPAYRDAKRSHRDSNEWPNGSVVVWKGLDNPEGLFSTEWDTIYAAEATEIELGPWDLLARSLRNQKTPYHQRIADCNPGPPGHWLNRRATPAGDDLRDSWKTRQDYNRLQDFNHNQPVQSSRPMRRLISVHPDNPGYWDMERWGLNDFGNFYVNSTLAKMSGFQRERMFNGRWKAAEGTVFPEFDEMRHVQKREFAPPSEWPIYWGYDPGVDHPTCILWFTVSPNGCLYVIDEIYGGGQSIPQHAAAVKARERAANWQPTRRWGDPQEVFNRQKASARTLADHWRDEGIRMTPWPRTGNNARDMVEAVRKRLIAGMFKVFAHCEHTIGEFQSWSYKRTAKGEMPDGDDQFEDRNNHAMDVIKGVVAANPTYKSSGVRIIGEDHISDRVKPRYPR